MRLLSTLTRTIACLPWFFIIVLTADSGRGHRFDHLSVEDGLSQSTVYTILQDDQGFMWFGTADGLNRYDGYEFRIYHHDTENSESIPGDEIFKIFTDSMNKMWIGTAGNGLAQFDPNSGKFICYGNVPDDSTSLINNKIWDIAEDSEGRLWIATEGGGLELFDSGKGI